MDGLSPKNGRQLQYSDGDIQYDELCRSGTRHDEDRTKAATRYYRRHHIVFVHWHTHTIAQCDSPSHRRYSKCLFPVRDPLGTLNQSNVHHNGNQLEVLQGHFSLGTVHSSERKRPCHTVLFQ